MPSSIRFCLFLLVLHLRHSLASPRNWRFILRLVVLAAGTCPPLHLRSSSVPAFISSLKTLFFNFFSSLLHLLSLPGACLLFVNPPAPPVSFSLLSSPTPHFLLGRSSRFSLQTKGSVCLYSTPPLAQPPNATLNYPWLLCAGSSLLACQTGSSGFEGEKTPCVSGHWSRRAPPPSAPRHTFLIWSPFFPPRSSEATDEHRSVRRTTESCSVLFSMFILFWRRFKCCSLPGVKSSEKVLKLLKTAQFWLKSWCLPL